MLTQSVGYWLREGYQRGKPITFQCTSQEQVDIHTERLSLAGCWGLMPVILATWEAEIGRIVV
jgi:hypothetical protein